MNNAIFSKKLKNDIIDYTLIKKHTLLVIRELQLAYNNLIVDGETETISEEVYKFFNKKEYSRNLAVTEKGIGWSIKWITTGA